MKTRCLAVIRRNCFMHIPNLAQFFFFFLVGGLLVALVWLSFLINWYLNGAFLDMGDFSLKYSDFRSFKPFGGAQDLEILGFKWVLPTSVPFFRGLHFIFLKLFWLCMFFPFAMWKVFCVGLRLPEKSKYYQCPITMAVTKQIFCSNASGFLEFGYDWYFIPRLCKMLNKTSTEFEVLKSQCLRTKEYAMSQPYGHDKFGDGVCTS